jgi:hypothetical protein
MSAVTQDIIYEVTGQTLYFDPPEGRASSVTSVAVYALGTGDDGTAEVATTGSASIDAVNTTFDAASGYSETNRRKCNLTATTSIAEGRTYLATNALLGEKEFVTVTGIKSADYVIVAEPLRNDYASADTFVGLRLSISVDSTWVADSTNISDDTEPMPGYRVRWVYVVGGVTYVHDAYFNLVRYPFAHSVTPNDMVKVIPNWFDRLPTYHQEDQGRRLISEAADEVRDDMFLSGHAPEMIRDAYMVDRLVMRKSEEVLERTGDSELRQAYTADRYTSLMDRAIRVVTKVAEATDTSGAGTDTVARALWGK